MGYSLLSKYRSELMGAAMLWVMLYHAEALEFEVKMFNLVRGAGFGGVDVFILLSAMGLAMSLGRREQEYASFMARRAKRILPAYFVVMVPYTLYLILVKDAAWSALVWNGTLLYYWMRSSGAFNWYVAGVMTFYAITPFCFRKLRDSKHRIALTGAAVFLSFALCRLLVREDYWYVMDVFYRVPVFFLGLLLGFFVLDGRKMGRKDLVFWTVWLVLGGGYLYASGNVPEGSTPLPLCHLFLFTTVPMCFGLCLLFEKLPLGILRKGLQLVGEHSLEIYLLNVSLFAERALLQQYLDFGPGHYIYYAITITLNILLGVLLHCLVKRAEKRFHSVV